MKLVVRVQYVGERARLLLREDQAADYTRGLIGDLETFGFPLPHEQKPIEKSGFMICVWHAEKDSDLHRAIQHAFIRAKEAPSLMDRSIRYISLNEDGVMHTTSLAHNPKPYKPKTYNKPMFGNHHIQDFKPFTGKAPKYPSSISQARKGVTPLSQRIAGPEPSSYSNYYADHDVDMHYMGTARTPPFSSDTSNNSVIDVTQQTLAQLSQSPALQSLLQRNPISQTIVKMEPPPPPDLSSLSPPPAATQTQYSNLQALLEKAGVKTSSAQAFLSAQNIGLPSKPSLYESGPNLGPVSSPQVISAASPSASISSLSTQPSLSTETGSFTPLAPPSGVPASRSAGLNDYEPRPQSTTPVPMRGSAVHATTRDLWDVRRRISALQAQESDLESELRRGGHPVPPKEGNFSYVGEQRVRALEDEITALREELDHEQQSRRVQEALLRAERVRRAELESVVKDATRECKQPFVVPALIDAFIKLGQMTGDTLKDAHGAVHPMEL